MASQSSRAPGFLTVARGLAHVCLLTLAGSFRGMDEHVLANIVRGEGTRRLVSGAVAPALPVESMSDAPALAKLIPTE